MREPPSVNKRSRAQENYCSVKRWQVLQIMYYLSIMLIPWRGHRVLCCFIRCHQEDHSHTSSQRRNSPMARPGLSVAGLEGAHRHAGQSEQNEHSTVGALYVSASVHSLVCSSGAPTPAGWPAHGFPWKSPRSIIRDTCQLKRKPF